MRMIDAYDAAATDEACATLARDITAFARDGVTSAQRSLILVEVETILRRLAAAEHEAARERDETAALDRDRDRYARAAETLAGPDESAFGDARETAEAISAADRLLTALHAADARTKGWLDAVKASVDALAEALAGDRPPADAAPSPAVLRSLSRVGAMLGAMLREAETQRDRTEEALSAARARPFAGLERNPTVAAAVARAERDAGGARRRRDG